jgi:hypothetical protein
MAFPVPARPFSACRPVRATPVLTFMGLNDVLVRYDDGGFGTAPATLDYWHDVNGCRGTAPDTTVTAGQSRCETYTRCVGGVEAGLCSITARTFGGAFFDGHILYLNDDLVLADVAWAFLSRFTLPDDVPPFTTATVAGTLRIQLRGEAPVSEGGEWQLGISRDTWWATDGAGRALAGAARGKGRKRTLVLSSDAATNLAAALAGTLGVAPEAVVLAGEPRLRAVLGKRAKLGGRIRLSGPGAGTVRVKLAGAAGS